MPRKARVEGQAANSPEVEPVQKGLAAIVEAFKAKHPEEWDALRLCPLQHGLDEMARLLG